MYANLYSSIPSFTALQFTQASQPEGIEVNEADIAVPQYGRNAVIENEMAIHYLDVV
jgi:hypothetical protein